MGNKTRTVRRYDNRLRDLVRYTGDIGYATRHGVPRSTSRGWLTSARAPVVSAEVVGMDAKALQAEVLRLQKRLAVLTAFLRLLFVLLRVSGFSLKNTRLPDGVRKQRLLRAIDRSCSVLPLRSVLRVLRLSHTRYHWWRREGECGLDDVRSCPHTSPQHLTPEEIETTAYRPIRPLFFWPLGAAILLVFVYHTAIALRSVLFAPREGHA